MTGQDLLITLILFLLFVLVGTMIRLYYSGDDRYRFFMPALVLKLMGGLAFAFIYKFYYGYGDTFGYFAKSVIVTDILVKSPKEGLELLFYLGNDIGQFMVDNFGIKDRLMYNQDTMIIIKLAALLNFLSFSNFYGTTLWFAILSFAGLWYGYIKMTNLFPERDLRFGFAVAFFFVPSVAFWGSGLIKDTVVIGFFWPLLFSLLPLTRLKIPSLFQILVIVVTGYIVFSAKAYIVYCLFPALAYLTYQNGKNRITNRVMRIFVTPIFLVALSGVSIWAALTLSEFSTKFNILDAAKTAQIYQEYNFEESSTGSSYSLPTFGGPITNFVANIPFALNVTFFRPYLWEINSVVMLSASLESLVFLLLFIQILRRGNWRQFRYIFKTWPTLMAILIFTLAFSYIVGFATYNFGTLVRYKIPSLICLLIIFFFIRHFQKHVQEGQTIKEL